MDSTTVSSTFSTVQSFITGPILTGSVALFVAVLTIRLGFKYVKRFAK